MANEFIARKGLKVLAAGIEVTGSGVFGTDITSSGNIRATAFYGNGANVTGVISSSYATTASLATNNLVTASGAGSTITFTKGDGSTFPVTITTATAATASYVDYTNVANKPTLISSSLQFNNLTSPFTGSFTGSYIGSLIGTASWASNAITASAATSITFTPSTASFATTASYVLPSGLPAGTISSSAQFNNILSPFTGSFTGSFIGTHSGSTFGTASWAISSSAAVTSAFAATAPYSGLTGVPSGIVSSSGQVTALLPTGTVSSSGQVDVRNTTGISTIATTGSNVFNGNQTITGSLYITDQVIIQAGVAGPNYFGDSLSDLHIFTGSVLVTGSITGNVIGNLTGTASYASSAPFSGLTGVPTLISSSGQVNHNATLNYVANQHIDHTTVSITAGAGLSGGGDITTTRTLTLDTSSAQFTTGSLQVLNGKGVISSSQQFNTYSAPFTGSFTGSFSGDGSNLTGIATTLNTAGTSGAGAINLKTQTLTINGGNGITTTASGQTITVSLPTGTVSSSAQVDVRNTTGIATIATTGSNTFTGIQTVNNNTNSTAFNNGALIVQGGLGVGRDVNISGSLTVTGLLTAVSTSIQYVTSSQVSIGTNRVIVNTNDNVRFGGLAVIDSGSTYGTGSILWDSLNNRFIYQADDQNYNSAIIIAGPQNTGSLGNEVGLIVGRVPVASGDDHIDTGLVSSSIRVDFPSRLTHVEAGLIITGSVTSSVGFSGDGSNLTGIVTNLNITGSTSGTGTISLKTQGLIVSGTNGVTATVSGQTVTISGSNATSATKGVASFNATNFTVTGGDVTSNNITINGTGVTLGGTRNITLQQITTQGATTTDQVTFGGGAIIHGTLFTSSSVTVPAPTNSVVATVPTASYDAAYFDYVLKSGTNLRAGTVMSVWQAGTSNVEFTDTSTNDIGNTLAETFTVDTLNGNVRLKLTGDSATWIVKTAIRMV